MYVQYIHTIHANLYVTMDGIQFRKKKIATRSFEETFVNLFATSLFAFVYRINAL